MVASTSNKICTLHPHQSLAMARKERFVALIAGTGGGKTYFGAPWICNEISQHPGDIWLILAPTYKILTRATMPTFLLFVQGTSFEGDYKESRGTYELPDGGLIYCMSTDNWKGIEGGQYRAAWLDEAGQMQYMAWVAVQARLGLKQGRCLFTTTPYATNWLYTEVLQKAEEGDRDFWAIQYRSIDNPYYPVEEYDRAKRSLPKHMFEMRYEGAFTRTAGLVYPELPTTISDKSPPKECNDTTAISAGNGWERYGGIDWGFSDPCVILVGAVDPLGTLHLFYEHYEARQTLESHFRILQRNNLVDDVTYFADPSGAQQIADMRKLGLAVHKGVNSIESGIATVTSRIKNQRVIIYHSQCPQTIQEAKVYRYPNEEDTISLSRLHNEIPIDDNNHAMDAFRYLIRGVDGNLLKEGDFERNTFNPQQTYEEEQALGEKLAAQKHPDALTTVGAAVSEKYLDKRQNLEEQEDYLSSNNEDLWSSHGSF